MFGENFINMGERERGIEGEEITQMQGGSLKRCCYLPALSLC